VYNEARVEVLLLHVDDETHQFSAVPERPFVDCGSVQVDTECDVMIEPHSQTFSIAIRAYNINNPDGSFVIIDNIRYEASLCKTSSKCTITEFCYRVSIIFETAVSVLQIDSL
jgi:hypothetical protein